MSSEISQGRLRELLDYDLVTGLFRWRVRTSNRVSVGDIAGRQAARGYVVICVEGKTYPAHRLAWLWVTGHFPPAEIDHINGDRIDNRWCNLRSVGRSQNAKNLKLPRNNKSGRIGVSFHKETGKWRACIRHQDKQIHLGLFVTFEEACAARRAAEVIYDFHQNHGRSR